MGWERDHGRKDYDAMYHQQSTPASTIIVNLVDDVSIILRIVEAYQRLLRMNTSVNYLSPELRQGLPQSARVVNQRPVSTVSHHPTA